MHVIDFAALTLPSSAAAPARCSVVRGPCVEMYRWRFVSALLGVQAVQPVIGNVGGDVKGAGTKGGANTARTRSNLKRINVKYVGLERAVGPLDIV